MDWPSGAAENGSHRDPSEATSEALPRDLQCTTGYGRPSPPWVINPLCSVVTIASPLSPNS